MEDRFILLSIVARLVLICFMVYSRSVLCFMSVSTKTETQCTIFSLKSNNEGARSVHFCSTAELCILFSYRYSMMLCEMSQYCISYSPVNSFVLGPAVIKTHTHTQVTQMSKNGQTIVNSFILLSSFPGGFTVFLTSWYNNLGSAYCFHS